MKKITLLLCLLLVTLNNYGQDQTPQLEELLERYQEIPANGNALTAYFTVDEISALRSHFSNAQEEDITIENRGGGIIFFGNSPSNGGLVSFSSDTPETLNLIGSNSGSADFESAGDIDPTNLNRAYALTLGLGEFYEVDITTATYTFLGMLTAPGIEQWNGLEFDPVNNILYGISSNFVDSSTLSIIDIPNLTVNPIGITGMPGAIAIAFDGSGNLYGYDVVDDSFYSINPTTGQATVIGFIGFDANFGQDLEWDPTTGTMYMTSSDGTSSADELRIVDLSTGNTTLVGPLGDGFGSQIPWAAIPNDGTLSINDLQLINFTLYPNPAQNSITLNAAVPINKVIVYDILGQKVMEKEPNTLQDQLAIDSLNNGLYLIRVFINDQTITQRFIKN